MEEPRHETLPIDKEYYSHKFNSAGLSYEIALSLWSDRCIWVNGPFKAGTSDLAIYKQPNGLHSVIPMGKKVIADDGYKCSDEKLCTSNPEDTVAVKKFKRRAKLRQESFNGKVKAFHCLSERFNRSLHRHKFAFDAVCVIVQMQLENGSVLYDI